MDEQSVTEYDARRALQTLTKYVDSSVRRMKNAEEKVNNWNKDEEIAKRDRIIEELRHELCHETWSFPKSDRAAAEEFYLKHCRLNHSPYYQFTPTSISTCCEVICSCGEKFTSWD